MTRQILRGIAAVAFIAAGVNHFVAPTLYRKIVPPGFGDPKTMVEISGIAEIAGGVGLLVPRLRRAAGWGLIALLVAVFPANVYMAYARDKIGTRIPAWALWTRLPVQGVLIAWVWFVALGRLRRR